jgi:hypothetical protein
MLRILKNFYKDISLYTWPYFILKFLSNRRPTFDQFKIESVEKYLKNKKWHHAAGRPTRQSPRTPVAPRVGHVAARHNIATPLAITQCHACLAARAPCAALDQAPPYALIPPRVPSISFPEPRVPRPPLPPVNDSAALPPPILPTRAKGSNGTAPTPSTLPTPPSLLEP